MTELPQRVGGANNHPQSVPRWKPPERYTGFFKVSRFRQPQFLSPGIRGKW